ncbi:hypothetical protein JD844_012116 [Phrynosoma platyrhinos]|uniref:Meiosis-specific kinetochore protein n=1 Tax=Phrynosoma platyrhinos TaxID=52577 RepID=A0ABQ7TK58_PHRPL|nr:hypothetical protein JD844_012116 [Phrynosoma platyrhinos]
MDWMKLRSYSRKRQAQKNIHCGSPLPGVAASAAGDRRNAAAKGPQSRLDLHPKPRLESHGKRHNRNAITKALPKIHEISEVTEMNCISSDQRYSITVIPTFVFVLSMEVNKDINEMDTTAPKDSLNLNSTSKKSLRNSESTSGMTLPTGVSDFLLDCLDVDSLMDSSTESSDCTSHYSSPEIFRDEKVLKGTGDSPEGPCLGYRNSTLLDTSKATNIDKMPQLPNLSKILGGQDQRITRSSQQKLHSGLTNASVIVAGKQVHKILSTKELRSESLSSGPLLLPPKHKTQSSDRKSKPDIPCRNAAENIVAKQPDAKMEISSRSVKLRRNRAVLASTAFLQPENVEVNGLCLCNPPEICSIIKASPGFRPLKVLQHPLNKKELFFPPESSEDIITSSENWVCNNDR